MGDWEKLAFIHIALGIETNVLGMLASGGGEEVEALLIIGFLLYLPAFLLLLFQVLPEGDLKGNKIVTIVVVCLVLCAALFVLIAVIVWGADYNINQSYACTLDITSVIMGIIGGIFLILMLAGVGGGSGGGGKTTPAEA